MKNDHEKLYSELYKYINTVEKILDCRRKMGESNQYLLQNTECRKILAYELHQITTYMNVSKYLKYNPLKINVP